MKKLVLMSVCLFAVSLFAKTSVADYIQNDLTEMQKKTTGDSCAAKRYTEMVGKVTSMTTEQVRSKIEQYCGCIKTETKCANSGLSIATFDYKGTTYTNALVLAPTTACADDKEPTGKRWFFGADECLTTDYTKSATKKS